MRDFTKSMLRFSWAMTLFGTQQMFDLARSQGDSEQLNSSKEAFDQVTQATVDEMENITKSAFQIGDGLQRSMVDLMFGMASCGSSGEGSLDRMMTDIGRQSASAMRQGIRSVQQTANSMSQTMNTAGATATNAGSSSSSGWGPMPASSGAGFAQEPPTATGGTTDSTTNTTESSGGGWGPVPRQNTDSKSGR